MAGSLYFFDRGLISPDEERLVEALAKIPIEIIPGLTIYVVSMAVVGREALKELRATLVSPFSHARGRGELSECPNPS
jgi:hypothetical protein